MKVLWGPKKNRDLPPENDGVLYLCRNIHTYWTHSSEEHHHARQHRRTMSVSGTLAMATPVVAVVVRRSQRQQEALSASGASTRRSQRVTLNRRKHDGNDAKIYGEDYGILPSD